MAFGIVTKEVMLDPDVSLEAKGVYALLSTYADKNRECFPSLKTISDAVGRSTRQVIRLISELEKVGYLKRIKRTGTSTKYKLG
jgi:DNA-binding IclR family transcriptional regulator